MNPRKRILIVDEEIDLCLLMKTYFLRKNYEVYISHDCREAFLIAKDCQPNVIFLSTTVCRDPEDIAKIKSSVPNVEIIINDHRRYTDV